MERIQDADCVLVSWRTKIDREVIASHPSIRYIGMCCSLYDERSANVDIAAARAHGIEVRGVRDYGDEGVAEFVMSELIRLLKGLGPHQWLSEPVELQQRKLGIIGMGATGQILAHRASAFGMRVQYFSRSRKPDCEQEGYEYVPLRDLLQTSEIISMHLPRNTKLLGPEEFAALGHGKILVNTSLGAPFEAAAFGNGSRRAETMRSLTRMVQESSKPSFTAIPKSSVPLKCQVSPGKPEEGYLARYWII